MKAKQYSVSLYDKHKAIIQALAPYYNCRLNERSRVIQNALTREAERLGVNKCDQSDNKTTLVTIKQPTTKPSCDHNTRF